MLAAILAVTGLSVAQARGHPAPVGALVICQGLTVATILVDAEGQPVERSHICPDAALSLFVEMDGEAAPQPQALVWRWVAWPRVDGARAAQWGQAAQARGPPAGL